MKKSTHLLICTFFILLSANVFSKAVDVNGLGEESIGCRGKDQTNCTKQLRNKIQKQKKRTVNIVVIPLESEFGNESANVSTSLLKKELVINGSNVVDRKIRKELKQELKAIAEGGFRKNTGFNYADFAIKGEVLNLATSRVFKIAENNCTVLGEDCPIRCVVDFSATVRLTVFDANPLEKVTDFVFKGENTKTYNNVTEESCNLKDISQDLRLGFQKTFSENAGKITASFSNDGYVTALAKSGKKYFVRTHLPKSEKYPKGTKAEIILTTKVNDAILGEMNKVKSLAKGEVVETVGDNFVWIKLKNKNLEPKDILLGDIIKINAKIPGCRVLDFKCKAAGAGAFLKGQVPKLK